MTRRHRRGEFSFSDILFLLGILVGIYTAYLVIPAYWEDMEMKEVLAQSLFTFHEKGEERSQEILQRELEKREMNPDLYQACEWYELRMQNQQFIHCSWDVDLYAPWGTYIHTLSFQLHQGINQSGEIFDVQEE